MTRIRLVLLVAAATLFSPGVAAAAPRPVELELLGRTAALGEGGAEISAFDAASEQAYATNAAANALDIYDLSDPSAPVRVRSVDLSPYGGGPNSVAVSGRHGGLVAVAVEAVEPTDPGTVEFFDTDGEHIATVPAGALPDMVTFTPDGRTLLAANEGEPSDTADPDGSVTLIDLRRGPRRARTRTATFDGVPVFGETRSFTDDRAADFEPEYIAVTPGGRLAYVTIQEANAIGVLSVDLGRFVAVRGLGYKNHGLTRNALDPSDRDGGIFIRPWANVFGMYQPDAIAAYTSGHRLWLVTANEGDARVDGSEEDRVEDLTLDPAAFPDPEVKGDAALGRLTVTNRQGDTDGDGDFDRLYAFGGRSLSILDPFAGVHFDTGDGLEQITARLDAANFNKDNEAGSPFDNRSDNKGPEPEGVDVGEVRGRTYAFAAAERSGGLFAYDLSDRPGAAGFAGYLNTREADLGPEGVRFVGAEASPSGAPLVLVTNEITGTLSVLGVG